MKLALSNNNVFFTSDTHFSHANICSATTKWDVQRGGDSVRQFDSLDKMNDTIVNNINSMVKEDDVLFHLGDWSFGGLENIKKFRERIVCKNIHLVLGNHDHHIENNKDNVVALFSSVSIGNLELEVSFKSITGNGEIKKMNFFLNHYPVCSWKNMNRRVIHLFGHVHLPFPHCLRQGRAIDVGVDGNDYNPYSLGNILSIMADQPVSHISLPYDHHSDEVK